MFGRELTTVAPRRGAPTGPSSGTRSRWPGCRGPTWTCFFALARASADGAVPAQVRPLPGAFDAVAALAAAGIRQSCSPATSGRWRRCSLRLAGLGEHLDLDVAAYGDAHEVRAEW